MTPLAVGIDLVEIGRVHRLLQRHRDRFRARVFTPAELALCRDRPHLLAARFAAKEATMKALGTGIRGVGWRDIECLPNRRGKPLLFLYGRARERARTIGLTGLDVSLTHSRDYAMATVVGTQQEAPEDPQAERRRLMEWLESGATNND
jgi:holo-[acyl-carrier protein] synthase